MSDDWIHNPIVKYEERDLIAVPLEGGQYGVALVARWSKASRRDHKTIICYGFNRLFNRVPTHEEVGHLTPCDAVVIGVGGDRAVARGYWRRLGPALEFTYERWPVPPFRGMFSGRPIWHVGDRLDVVDVREDIVPEDEMAVLPPDRGMGTSRFMEWCLEIAVQK